MQEAGCKKAKGTKAGKNQLRLLSFILPPSSFILLPSAFILSRGKRPLARGQDIGRRQAAHLAGGKREERAGSAIGVDEFDVALTCRGSQQAAVMYLSCFPLFCNALVMQLLLKLTKGKSAGLPLGDSASKIRVSHGGSGTWALPM